MFSRHQGRYNPAARHHPLAGHKEMVQARKGSFYACGKYFIGNGETLKSTLTIPGKAPPGMGRGHVCHFDLILDSGPHIIQSFQYLLGCHFFRCVVSGLILPDIFPGLPFRFDHDLHEGSTRGCTVRTIVEDSNDPAITGKITGPRACSGLKHRNGGLIRKITGHAVIHQDDGLPKRPFIVQLSKFRS